MARILSNPRLALLQVIQAPQGSNFPVTADQAFELRRIVDADSPPPPISQSRRIWMYAPGKDAIYWDEFFDAGIMAIGWDALGDLSQYGSPEDIAAAHKDAIGTSENPRNDARACFDFAKTMQPGDIVYAKRGTSKVIGCGFVTGPYEWQPSRPKFKNTRSVRWTVRGDWTHKDTLTIKTLTDITEYADYVADLEQLVSQPIVGTRPMEPVIYPDYTLDDATSGLFMSKAEFLRARNLLLAKKNLILQGAPGVGKSFVARRLANFVIGHRDPKKLAMVQFHQSYAYEDFVQGFRPTSQGIQLKNGLFFEFCQRAAAQPQAKFVFVIDEINRGNLSKIFGELLLLIEGDKRGPQWQLPLLYSEEPRTPFFVPENLYLIGLMNTADRSLSMVDYALRRRFAFVSLEPKFGSQTFRDHLVENGVEPSLVDKICTRMMALNEDIAADKSNLGPGFCVGHSFFSPTESGAMLDESWFRNIIETEIAPLLGEYWFDDPNRADTYVQELLR
jgi:5-methylcytosine-specific restriction protein B